MRTDSPVLPLHLILVRAHADGTCGIGVLAFELLNAVSPRPFVYPDVATFPSLSLLVPAAFVIPVGPVPFVTDRRAALLGALGSVVAASFEGAGLGGCRERKTHADGRQRDEL